MQFVDHELESTGELLSRSLVISLSAIRVENEETARQIESLILDIRDNDSRTIPDELLDTVKQAIASGNRLGMEATNEILSELE